MSVKLVYYGVSALALMAGQPVLAQDSDGAEGDGPIAEKSTDVNSAVDAIDSVIVVTGTKGLNVEDVQDVPLAVTAFGSAQLDALQTRNLQSLTYSVPNVALDDVGTTKGVANFSIRGLGINSSIPSIDPTVGVFVDGMYLGINQGVLLDVFDLESVEVLRGPQGILFGRNTTGGAVLINTRRPPDEFEVRGKIAAESGLKGSGGNYYAMASVGGPVIPDVLNAKLVAYYNRDDGWFENYLGGPGLEGQAQVIGGTVALLQNLGFPIAVNQPDALENFGKSKTFILRPSFEVTAIDDVQILLRYEHGQTKGDGPQIQNHPGANDIPNIFYSADRNTFDFSVNTDGFFDNSWDQLIGEVRWDLGPNTAITSITGWRQFESDTRGDLDGTPFFLFHADLLTDQDQFSQELRLNTRLGEAVELTLGGYYFDQSIFYNERREILGGYLYFNGGGRQEQSTVGIFGQADISLTDALSVNLGLRYTHEEKDVVISTLILNTTQCDVRIPGSCSEDFADSKSWKNLTPKVGLTWEVNPDLNTYASWTRGVRSGGYNFRNSGLSIAPGPFDEETVDSFEAGFKAQPGRATINAAVFVTKIEDMQREINLPDPLTGVVQVIRNTADATIFGFEVEGRFRISNSLVVTADLGYLDGDYDVVRFDLTNDGIIDDADTALEIPRLSPWTYGLGLIHSLDVSNTILMNSRMSFSHRDRAFYTDNNAGYLNSFDALDASISLDFGKITATAYAKNLLNEVNHGGDTQLPATLGFGAGGSLTKGRVFGLELQAAF